MINRLDRIDACENIIKKELRSASESQRQGLADTLTWLASKRDEATAPAIDLRHGSGMLR